MQVKEFNIQTKLMRSCILLQNTEVYMTMSICHAIYNKLGKLLLVYYIDLLSMMKIWGWSD